MTDVCSNGTNAVTITCDATLTNVIWYNAAGVQVGTGCDLIVNNTLVGTGMVGQTECFYYVGDDANSCPAESCCPVNVTVLNCMTCMVQVDDVSCNGAADGEALALPTNGVAPFTYLWSDSQTTATAINLAGGTYTVTVTDSAGGTSVCSDEVIEPAAITCTMTGTDVSCFGGSDGTATVAAAGGTPGYTYIWSDLTTVGTTATGLSAGTHFVTITDDAGCELVCDITLMSPTELSCTITATDLLCNGDNSGELDLNVTGGTLPLTYDWSVDGPDTPDDDTQDLTGLAAGTYDVTVTDANGCTTLCSGTVDEPLRLTCTAAATDESDCGGMDGTIVVTASEGTPGYTYSLNGGASQSISAFTGLSAGSYTVTTQDDNGCTTECVAVVNTPTAPMCSIGSMVNVSCNGGNDGSLVAMGTGGSGNYEYSLDGGAFTSSGSFTMLAAGSYTVTVRNVGDPNCISVCNVTITEPTLVNCTVTTTDVSCNGGQDGTATVVATGGTGPYTYVWNSSPAQTSATASMLTAGSWSVTVTDDNSCTTVCSGIVAEPSPVMCTLAKTDILCNGGNNGEITITGTGGTPAYEYSLNGGPYQPGNSFANLTAGTYVVTIRDDNACMSSCSTTLIEPDPLSCTNDNTDVSDCGADDGTITTTAIGGVSPYSYSLNGGPVQTSNTFTDLGSGSYTVDITDDNGCTTQCVATVDAPDAPMCSIDPVTMVDCNGNMTGSLTAVATGGSGTYEYSLDATVFQSSGVYSGLAAGSYTVTVRNVGNPMCISTCSVTITEPDPLTCTTTVVATSCPGGADGSATVIPAGGTAPFSYIWSDAQTTETAVGLSAGNYSVVVTDANDCETACDVQILEPLDLTCSLVAVNLSCNNADDGSLTVTAMGGTASYEFSLDGGPYQPGNVFSSLAAGSYIVSVRDINGCLTNCSMTITEPPVLTCSVAATDASNCGVNDGTLTVTASGGSAGYTYAVDGGTAQSSNIFLGLGAGSYTVDVVDANGCMTTCNGTINAPSAPMCSIVKEDVTCSGGSDGNITTTGSGGSGNYEFSIDGVVFQTSGVFTDLVAGSYTITVRNIGQNNCISTCNVLISEPPAIACTATGNNPSCQGGTDGNATVTITGGTAPYTYLWNSGQSTATITGIGEGNYMVTITDSNNCMTTCSVALVAPPTVVCTLSSMDVSCAGSSDGIVIVMGSGGTPEYEYSLSGMPFQPGNVFNGLSADTYTVNIRDENGCISSCTIDVAEPSEVSCFVSSTDASDCNVNDGSLSATGLGGVAPYEFSINAGAYQPSGTFAGLSSGTYTITVRDSQGCTSECSGSVNAPSAPMCSITVSMNVTCNGGNDGSFTVTGTGGSGSYEYSLDGGPFGSISTFDNLVAGSYNVTVRNIGNAMCTSNCNVTITEPAPLACTTTATDALCNASNEGTATVFPTGGVAAYTYVWSDAMAQTTETAVGLIAGNYRVTVSDANGCTSTCEATVNNPNLLTCSLDIVDADCATMTPGSITVMGTGGTPVYEFSTDGVNYQAGNVFNNIGANDYTVYIRDANGCISTCVGTVNAVNCNFDLALIKTINSSTPGPYSVGSTVTFDISVINQGTIDAFNVNVNDYIPTGLILADTDWTVTGSTATLLNPIPFIGAGSQIVATITFTIDPAFMGTSIINNAEISQADDDTDPNNADPMDSDSTPNSETGDPSDPNNDDTANTTGGDDYDPEEILIGQVYDLALIKEVVTPGPYTPGQDVLYEISVCNQGTLDANSFTITDHIPAGMTLSTTAGSNGGWMGPATGPVTYTYTNVLAAQDPDACASIFITLTIDANFMGTSLVNNAEITTDDGDDVDSDPAVYMMPDDFADDDSLAETDGGDDEDPEEIQLGQIYDLALLKDIVTPGPYAQGQDVTYAITVCNQGTLDANFFEITDMIPSGMSLSSTAGANTGWAGGPNGSVTYAYNSLLSAQDPDACVTINITLTIDPTFMGTTLLNLAEISDDDGDDVDSTPGVDDGPDTDDVMNDGADDEDPEEITLNQVYDLALLKQVVTPGPYVVGQDVMYEITVCNQGTLDANFIEVTDNIPAGMSLSTAPGVNGGWMGPAAGPVVYTHTNTLAAVDPDACVSIFITLTIDPAFMGTSITNEAEISDDDGDDIDSTPSVDDGPDTDNNLNDGADDEDPETITLGQVYDLALLKTIVTPGPYAPGQDVTYEITVCNQGSLNANFFEITDAIPAGMTLSSVPGNTGWSGPVTGPVTYNYTSLLPAQDPDACASVFITLTIDANFMGTSLLNEAEISDDDGNDVDSTPGVDDGPDTDGDLNDGADDEDPELIAVGQIYDLALTKEVITAGPYVAGQDVMYEITVCNQGTLDANNIVVTDHIPAGMSLSTTPGTNGGWMGAAAGPVTYTYTNVLAAQNPDACASIFITLTIDANFMGTSLVNNAEITTDDGDDVDSDPAVYMMPDDFADDDSLTETDGGDDEDPEEILLGQSYDLALIKEVITQGPYALGQDVTYTITVCNQGTLDANFFEVTDHIPAGMTLSTTAGTNAGWVGGPTGDVTYANNGLLAASDPDACIAIPITLTIDANFMGTSLVNEAEISDDDGNDTDSTPGVDDGPDTDNVMNDGADDEDPEEIILEQVYDLALLKQVVTPGPYVTGQNVTYEIMVCNQGTLDANFFEVTDVIPAGMTLSPVPANAGWVGPINGPVSFTYNNLLPAQDPDACASVFITLTIDAGFMGTSLVNQAEISDDDGDDVDSTPSVDDGPDTDNNLNDGADDEDPEAITLGQVYDLALLKTIVTPGPYAPGQDVTYEITVCNQGTLDANFFEITDNVPAGMSLSSVTGNTGWNGPATGPVTYSYNMLLAAQDPDACASVFITLTIDANFMGTSLVNEAEISDDDGNDVDSTPGVDDGPDTDGDLNDGADDEDPETITIGQTYDLALTKVLATGQSSVVAPGDPVAFKITVFNQGSLVADNIEVTDYIPNGFTFNSTTNPNWTDNLNGTATTTLSVANGDLPAGGLAPGNMVMVNIDLDVSHNAPQGQVLTNWAEISGDDGNDNDSTTDTDQTNDGFGGDNLTDGSGGDEDDHDPAEVTVAEFDLALVKTLAAGQSQMVAVGEQVNFTITVTNQGDVNADNIQIADYLPSCMTLADTDWTGTNPAYYTISVANGDIPTGGLAPNATVDVNITLMVDASATPACDLTNWAEIANATDVDGDPIPDVDSTPNDNPGDDTFGGDNVTNNAGGDEDDHDPAEVFFMPTCDLALIKEFAEFQSNGNGTGGLVTFTITVFNQGGCDAYNVQLVDYILPGWALSDNDWFLNTFNGNAYYTITGPILPGTSQSVDVTMSVTAFDPLAPQINYTEIVSSEEMDGTPQADDDSTPNDNPADDGIPTDNEYNNANNDEDDHDPEPIQIMDLAIDKSITTAGPYSYGQLVEFNICVTNEGNMTAYNVEITDYIPAGFSYLAASNTAWSGFAPDVVHTIPGPVVTGQVVCQNIFLTLEDNATSISDYTNVTEISDVEDVNGDNPDDWDSTPENDDGDQSEDDEDAVVVEVFDLALTKVYDSYIDLDGNNILTPTDDVIFAITVTNQGTVDGTNVEITDYVPSDMMLSSSDTNGWVGTATGTVVHTITSLPALSTTTIFIRLNVNASFQGTNIINWAEISEDNNTDVDSTPDGTQFNGAGETNDLTDDDVQDNSNGDEDDHDPAEVTFDLMYDLALTKEYVSFVDFNNSGDISQEDDVLFTITVTNQGSLNGNNIEITDYIPAGMSLSPNDSNGWVGPLTGPVTNTIASVPANGAPVTLDIILRVDATFMGTQLVNWAEISNDDGNDIDSTPDGIQFNGPGETDDLNDDNLTDNTNGDEDDHDPAPIMIGQTFDLALMKMVAAGQSGPYEVFDDITFDITIYNQGSLDAYNIDIVDYVQPGLALSPNDTNGWTLNAAGDYMTTIAGPLTPGNFMTVSITMRVTQEAYSMQLTQLTNVAEIAGSEDVAGNATVDSDSTADANEGNDAQTDDVTDNSAGDEDDEDPAFAPLAPLDPTGHIYCDKTGRILTGGTVSVSGPGNITYGTDANGVTLDGSNGYYQYFVDAPGVYTITYNHPLGYPMSSTCLPLSGTFDPSNEDGGIYDKDMMVNGNLVMGSDVQGGNLADFSCGFNPYFMSVDLQPADPPIISFNNIPIACVIIQSTVCEDTDLDGVAEPTDPGFDGIPVFLYSCSDLNNPVATTVTANGGQYLFDGIEAGCYRLFFDTPNGYTVIDNPAVNDNGWTGNFFVNWGECYAEGAFCLTMADAGLGNYVWHDLDGDGVQDFGEPGIPGVKVSLYTSTGVLVGIQYTDFMGQYLFENLSPGHYYLAFEGPEGYQTTTANSGNNDGSDSDLDGSNGPGTTANTWLDAGELDLSWDAGFYKCIEIGDFLWLDWNENGVQDAVENGINGVRVNLYERVNGASFLVDYTYTGQKPGTPSDDGYFHFCAPPGDYYLEFEVNNTAYTPSTPGVGAPGSDSNVTGGNGQNTTSTFSVLSCELHLDMDGGYEYIGPVALEEQAQDEVQVLITNARDLKFKGANKGNYNLLEWEASETEELGYYQLERKVEGESFVIFAKIMTVSEAGNNAYAFKDYDMTESDVVYRLSMVVDDNQTNLGEVTIENASQTNTLVRLYPTIATNYATLSITTDAEVDFSVTIFNLAGQILNDRIIRDVIKPGISEYRIDTDELTPGIYNLRVVLGKEVTTKKLIVVQN